VTEYCEMFGIVTQDNSLKRVNLILKYNKLIVFYFLTKILLYQFNHFSPF